MLKHRKNLGMALNFHTLFQMTASPNTESILSNCKSTFLKGEMENEDRWSETKE